MTTENAPKGNNGFATASLVLGILGILTLLSGFGGLFGLAALVTGIIALVQINKNNGAGKGLAIAGLVCGVLIFVLPIIFAPAISNIFNSVNSKM